jgi:hypothetical protein
LNPRECAGIHACPRTRDDVPRHLSTMS